MRSRRFLVTAAAVAPFVAPTPAPARPDTKVRYTYATCYSLRGQMADGTYVRWGSVASNWLRLGTRVTLVGRTFYGRRRFVVRDTGSALSDGRLDFWSPSTSACRQWGYRRVAYRIGWWR